MTDRHLGFFCFGGLVVLSVLFVGKEIHRGKAVIYPFKLVLATGAQMDEQLLECACQLWMRLQITWKRDPNFGTRTYQKKKNKVTQPILVL